MRGRRRIQDGVYLAVFDDGTIAGGVSSKNPYPKVYTTLDAAVIRAKDGNGMDNMPGHVLHVTDKGVEVVWPPPVVPRTFFLNERHELPDISSARCGGCGFCKLCGYD